MKNRASIREKCFAEPRRACVKPTGPEYTFLEDLVENAGPARRVTQARERVEALLLGERLIHDHPEQIVVLILIVSPLESVLTTIALVPFGARVERPAEVPCNVSWSIDNEIQVQTQRAFVVNRASESVVPQKFRRAFPGATARHVDLAFAIAYRLRLR